MSHKLAEGMAHSGCRLTESSHFSRFKGMLLTGSCIVLLSIHAGAQKFDVGTPGPGDGVQLVSDGNDPVVRYPVAHQHTASGCYGYLYFSNSSIRFEVLSPDKDKGHSFQYLRTQLTTARPWISMGSSFPEAEFKFSDGRTYHFFRIRRELAENSSAKLRDWNDVLDFNDLLQASRNLQDVLAMARAKASKADSESSGGGTVQAPNPSRSPDAGSVKPNDVARSPSESAANRPETALIVISSPGNATVYVNDEPKGTTSLEGRIVLRNLSDSDCRVRVTRDGYKDWVQSVRVVSGSTTTVEATLQLTGPPRLTVQDVVDLLKGGVSSTRIRILVTERGVDFVLDPDVEGRIRSAGGDAELLLAIARGKK